MVSGDDLLVEIGKPALVFGDQLRAKVSERSRGISRLIFDVPVRTDFFDVTLPDRYPWQRL
jgi:hypothetical protein